MSRRLEVWDGLLNRLLVAVVLVSLVLTGRIWVGAPTHSQAYEPFTLTPEKVEDPAIGRLLAPSLIVFHQGNDVHFGLLPGTEDYDRIWQQGKAFTQILTDFGGQKRDSVSVQEVQQARQEGPAVEFVLTDAYKLTMLGQVYGVSVEGDYLCDRIILSSRGGGTLYLRTGQKQEYVAVPLKQGQPNPAELLKLVPANAKRYVELPEETGGLRIAPSTFVPKDIPEIAMLSVQRDPTGASTILSTFFVDVSILRKIEERDGALIYSDGRRGVRIYPSGAVDYGQPQAGGEVDPMTAIERATVFAMQHGGLPGTTYVDRLSRQRDTQNGVRVRFAYRYSGIPLIGQRGALEVLVGSKGPESFLRNFRLPVGQAGVPRFTISTRDALLAVSASRASVLGTGDPGPVINMELAYLMNGPEEAIEPLRPVWAIEFQNAGSVVVDAYTGAVSRRVGP